jgi:hypothetical protein
MLGAVTGAVIGVSLDLGESAGRSAAEAAEAAGKALQEHGPELAAALGTAVARGGEKVKAAHLPSKARALAEKAGKSDTADSARDAAHTLVAGARDVGGMIAGHAQEIAGHAQEVVDGVRAKVQA